MFYPSFAKGRDFLTGQMAEGLGGGLQNLLRRFKSASDLEYSVSNEE